MRSPAAASRSSSRRDLAELGDAHLAEVADLEVVPLAGGFEFLLLLELGDGGASATPDGVAAAGTSVAGALIWAWSGHMGRGHLWEGPAGPRKGRGCVGAERAVRANRVAASVPVGVLGA